MGFGHRVYRKGDSRVPTMEQHFKKIANDIGRSDLVEMYDLLKDKMIAEKGIYPNLDFPAGPAYYLMGFEIDFFTPIFVISRITGWCAHILEQREGNKLIRPLAQYVGEPSRKVVPLSERG